MTNKNVLVIYSLILIFFSIQISSFAQCIEDTHSANLADSWLSCQTSVNPNALRGNSHWVMYDLGYLYTLGASTIWNYNVANETGQGFKDIFIDYSINGADWIEVGDLQLPEASGYSNYIGFDDFNFGEIAARYILITTQNNWEGSNCAGISEFRVEVSSISLPIDLLSFSADPKDDYIALNWESMDEFNFSHFEVERSVDAISFNKINRVVAKKGNSINEYKMKDKDVKKRQIYYYRLKIVDTDNSYEYSQIRTALMGKNLDFSGNVFM